MIGASANGAKQQRRQDQIAHQFLFAKERRQDETDRERLLLVDDIVIRGSKITASPPQASSSMTDGRRQKIRFGTADLGIAKLHVRSPASWSLTLVELQR